jgi:hypothetical protein
MVSNLAKEYGVDAQSRTFTPWSHVVSLAYAHLTHAVGLNNVCDGLVDCSVAGAYPTLK